MPSAKIRDSDKKGDNLGFPMLLIVVGTLRVPSLMKKGDKIFTHPIIDKHGKEP